MKKIFKYELEIDDKPQKIEMPIGAEVVFADMQAGILCIWAVVNISHPKSVRLFAVHGTGHPLPSDEIYIATVNARPFVWHIFEVLQAGEITDAKS